MSYASLLVNLDLEGDNVQTLEVAARFARDHRAAVTGIAAFSVMPPPEPMYGSVAQALLVEDVERIRVRMTELEEQLRSATVEHAAEFNWISAMESPSQAIIAQTLTADLLISGDGEASRFWLDPYRYADLKHVVMKAACPVFICRGQQRFKRAVVAWKDTKEARRAVLDSLPLLRRVEGVTVVQAAEGTYDTPQLANAVSSVSTWLRRHGITSDYHVLNGAAQPLEQLLEYSVRIGADIVVGGAYGRSRIREWALGGMTEGLFKQKALSCFLTH